MRLSERANERKAEREKERAIAFMIMTRIFSHTFHRIRGYTAGTHDTARTKINETEGTNRREKRR